MAKMPNRMPNINRGATREEARSVSCPDCQAVVGSPCIEKRPSSDERRERPTNHQARTQRYLRTKPPRNQRP